MESNKKPSEINDVPDVYHFKDEIQIKYSDLKKEEAGKWLMFIEKSKLDEKWEEVCKIYDSGVLTGIYQVKCSTNYKNPRASDLLHGAIRFYCGPASDENKIMEYGENILKWIKYDSARGFMYYKTNEQSKAGTRATGQKINYTYRIPVPAATTLSANLDKGMNKLSIQPTRKSSDDKPDSNYTMKSNKKPSEINDVPDVYHLKDEIQIKYSDLKKEEAGKWLMFIEKSKLDEKWEEVCKIYDTGILTGIYQVKCSTNYKNPRTTDLSHGAIRFYCGPASDEKKIMEYGKNILKWIKYENACGFMYYKTNEQSKAGTRALGQKRNSTYRIAVPRATTTSANLYKGMNKSSIQRTRKSSNNKPHSSYTYVKDDSFQDTFVDILLRDAEDDKSNDTFFDMVRDAEHNSEYHLMATNTLPESSVISMKVDDNPNVATSINDPHSRSSSIKVTNEGNLYPTSEPLVNRLTKCIQSDSISGCENEKSYKLLKYEDAPSYLQHNPYIRTGYRGFLSTKLCLESVFWWTNETINIWSHLFGFLLFLSLTIYDLMLLKIHAPYEDKLLVGAILLCFQICMILSATYHTFSCKSEKDFNCLLSYDLFGIAISLLSIYMSGIYYAFWCNKEAQYFYMISVSLIFLFALSLQIPRFNVDSNVKMIVFVGWAAYGVIPTLHWTVVQGGFQNPVVVLLLPRVLGMYAIVGIAFLIYISKIPERFFPGAVDYIGHSHQWWHLFVVLALYYWHNTGMIYIEYRMNHACSENLRLP